MHVQENGSAVSAESTAIGVSNDAAFETLAARIHGYGEVRVNGHVYAPTIVPCGDRWCARCTMSAPSGKAGESQPADDGHVPMRAIQTFLADGTPAGEIMESRTAYDNAYNAEIAVGGERGAKAVGDGITSKDAYLGAPVTFLMRASVEPDKRGSRSRSKKASNRQPDPQAVIGALQRTMAA